MNDIERINAAVERRRRRQNSRIKERYWLAKDLGFTPQEATVLQHKTEAFIRQLHSQKLANTCNLESFKNG